MADQKYCTQDSCGGIWTTDCSDPDECLKAACCNGYQGTCTNDCTTETDPDYYGVCTSGGLNCQNICVQNLCPPAQNPVSTKIPCCNKTKRKCVEEARVKKQSCLDTAGSSVYRVLCNKHFKEDKQICIEARQRCYENNGATCS